MPTIDVEGVHGNDPFNQMVLGNIGEKENWGIYKLAKIFSKELYFCPQPENATIPSLESLNKLSN